MTSADVLDVPETVGRYAIVRPLAEGGMGQLFLARATAVGGFRKQVVLKRLRPTFAGDPAYVRMLLDEAKVLATLDHPNIVQVVDVVLHEGAVYLVMEYLDGWDLKAVLARAGHRRGLAQDAAVAIAMSVCAALEYAHAQKDEDGVPLGIVHRDVSPGNVLVSADGGVKVIDFGIARSTLKEHVTETGMVRGKLAYMSPEQCRGARVDGRSDVFSIGVTLYEMLTGVLPHEGADDYELRKAIVERSPGQPAQLTPGLAPEIARVVLAALEKDPEMRPPTPAAFAAALHAAARAHGLDLSAFALAQHLRVLFGREPTALAGEALSAPRAIGSGSTVPIATSATISTRAPRAGGVRTAVWIGAAAIAAFGGGYFARTVSVPTPSPGSISTAAIDLVPSARPQRSEAEQGRAWGGPAARSADEGGQPYANPSASATSVSSAAVEASTRRPPRAPAVRATPSTPRDPDAPLPR